MWKGWCWRHVYIGIWSSLYIALFVDWVLPVRDPWQADMKGVCGDIDGKDFVAGKRLIEIQDTYTWSIFIIQFSICHSGFLCSSMKGSGWKRFGCSDNDGEGYVAWERLINVQDMYIWSIFFIYFPIREPGFPCNSTMIGEDEGGHLLRIIMWRDLWMKRHGICAKPTSIIHFSYWGFF